MAVRLNRLVLAVAGLVLVVPTVLALALVFGQALFSL
jgi:hypothetical protein